MWSWWAEEDGEIKPTVLDRMRLHLLACSTEGFMVMTVKSSEQRCEPCLESVRNKLSVVI